MTPEAFGPYVLLDRLGQGSMGEVFLARARGAGADYLVLKRLHADLHDDDLISRFKHEASVAVRVTSPHLVRVFEAGRINDRMYFTMEYIEGSPLSELLRRAIAERRRLPVECVVELVRGILEGLGALHAATDESGRPMGFVHRDIAPKNVMVGSDGIVRLIDLGIGTSSLKTWNTAPSSVIGTPGYMAPEQARTPDVTPAADLYAVGAILYELLTLERLVQKGSMNEMILRSAFPTRRPLSELRPAEAARFEPVLNRALAFDPEARFESAREFSDALSQSPLATSSAHIRALTESFDFAEESTSKKAQWIQAESAASEDLPSFDADPGFGTETWVRSEVLEVYASPFRARANAPMSPAGSRRSRNRRLAAVLLPTAIVVGFVAGVWKREPLDRASSQASSQAGSSSAPSQSDVQPAQAEVPRVPAPSARPPIPEPRPDSVRAESRPKAPAKSSKPPKPLQPSARRLPQVTPNPPKETRRELPVPLRPPAKSVEWVQRLNETGPGEAEVLLEIADALAAAAKGTPSEKRVKACALAARLSPADMKRKLGACAGLLDAE